MPDVAVAPVLPPLSQAERVLDTFIAPGKTFTDLLRNASWWLPCILVLAMSAVSVGTVLKKVGVERIADNMIATLPVIQDQISNAKPEQAQMIHSRMEQNLHGQLITAPLVLLASSFVTAGLFLLTANFAFGGSATYTRLLAVFWYSMLPLVVLSVLATITVSMGVNVENYRINNPLGTNPGYYMPLGSSPVLTAALSFLDVFSIWVFCLQGFGVAIIGRLSLGKAFAAVGICWLLYLLVKLAPVLIFS